LNQPQRRFHHDPLIELRFDAVAGGAAGVEEGFSGEDGAPPGQASSMQAARESAFLASHSHPVTPFSTAWRQPLSA
tara:strand:- start:454 stop:681 length:228 start_codon:yes stop_codon:yes gene_type:complete